MSDIFFKDIFSNLPDNCLIDTNTPGKTLEDSLTRTLSLLKNTVIQQKHPRWIVTYSGGKDSTIVTLLAIEVMRRKIEWRPDSVDIIYVDTLQEIPPLHQQALDFLEYIETLAIKDSIAIKSYIAYPDMQRRFWYLMFGKGYPPPNRLFWWCTPKLKVKPAQAILRKLNYNDAAVVLSGIRFGESQDRDRRIKKQSSCVGQGECGQVLEYNHAIAPIAHWKLCQVWDMLALYAPAWGWPTVPLVKLYGDSTIRFGCWTCTLVKRDRALEAVVENPEWTGLKAMGQFRDLLLQKAANPQNRLLHADGHPGRFKLEIRQELLDGLKQLERELNMPLIDCEEEEAIRQLWQKESPRIDEPVCLERRENVTESIG